MALAEVTEPWVPSDTFGARLALVRQKLGGWNVKKTAEFCDVDDQSWRNWEAGKSPQNYEAVCVKIAKAVGCDFHWLASGGPLNQISLWNFDSPDLSSVYTYPQCELPFEVDRQLAVVGP